MKYRIVRPNKLNSRWAVDRQLNLLWKPYKSFSTQEEALRFIEKEIEDRRKADEAELDWIQAREEATVYEI